jgi:hypothetical protein
VFTLNLHTMTESRRIVVQAPYEPEESSPVDAESVRIVAEALEKIARKLNPSSSKHSQQPLTEPEIAVRSPRRCSNYLRYRFLHSGLWKLTTGEGLSYEDADTTVNTLTLVAALLLTIPFSLVGTLTVEFWQGLQEELAACPAPQHPGYASKMYHESRDTLSCMTYTCIGAIIVAVMYYILRPKNDADFGKWWSHGRWGVFVLCGMTASAVVATMTLYGTLVGASVLMRFPGDICVQAARPHLEPIYQRIVAGGVGSLIFAWVFSLIAML